MLTTQLLNSREFPILEHDSIFQPKAGTGCAKQGSRGKAWPKMDCTCFFASAFANTFCARGSGREPPSMGNRRTKNKKFLTTQKKHAAEASTITNFAELAPRRHV